MAKGILPAKAQIPTALFCDAIRTMFWLDEMKAQKQFIRVR